MTEDEKIKQAIDETRTFEFFCYTTNLWQYFEEVCGLDTQTFLKELKNRNSEIIKKYQPDDFMILSLKIRNEILEEAIRRKVDIRETIAYQEYCEEMKNKQQDDSSKIL